MIVLIQTCDKENRPLLHTVGSCGRGAGATGAKGGREGQRGVNSGIVREELASKLKGIQQLRLSQKEPSP